MDLKMGDCPRLSKWAQCDHRGPDMSKREADVMVETGFGVMCFENGERAMS